MEADRWFDKSLEAMDKMAQVNVDFIGLSMTKSEWASWAQAITAIAGITVAVITFLLSIRQRNKERFEDERNSKDKDRRIAETILVQFVTTMKSIYQWLSSGSGQTLQDVQFRRVILEMQLELLRELPLHVLEEEEIAKIYLIKSKASEILSAMLIVEKNSYRNSYGIFIVNDGDFLNYLSKLALPENGAEAEGLRKIKELEKIWGSCS